MAMRSINLIIRDLEQPHPRFEKEKTLTGSTKCRYIPWTGMRSILNLHAPGWSSEVVSVKEIGGRMVARVRITIPCEEGMVWHEGCGEQKPPEAGKQIYGDQTKNACSAAFKRAAQMFGIAGYLRGKSQTFAESNGSNGTHGANGTNGSSASKYPACPANVTPDEWDARCAAVEKLDVVTANWPEPDRANWLCDLQSLEAMEWNERWYSGDAKALERAVTIAEWCVGKPWAAMDCAEDKKATLFAAQAAALGCYADVERITKKRKHPTTGVMDWPNAVGEILSIHKHRTETKAKGDVRNL